MNYISRLGKLITSAFSKAKGKKVSVNKNHILEDIGYTKKKLEIFSKCIESMPMSYRKSLSDKIFDLSSNKTMVGCIEYVNMARTLSKNDLSVYFASFESCANSFIKIINSVLDDFDKVFDNKEIVVENVDLGQLAVFGMMEQASLFSKFCSYLLDMVSNDILTYNESRQLNSIAQYKVVFVNINSTLIYELVSNLLRGYTNYLNDIKKVVKSSSNVKLLNNLGETNIGMIDPDEHMNNLFLRRATFNPFFIIGETWAVMRHLTHQKTIKEREYLDSHIALLKLQLDGKDPDSQEYQHHVKVINSYNEMLTRLDEKISKYENS